MKNPGKRLERIRRKKELAQRKLQLLISQETALQAQEAYKKNPEYRRLEKAIRAAKRAIQVGRVNIARKGYSIESHRRHITALEGMIEEHRRNVDSHLNKLTELTQLLDAIRRQHIDSIPIPMLQDD
jgi:hypothetical protein